MATGDARTGLQMTDKDSIHQTKKKMVLNYNPLKFNTSVNAL